MGRRDIQMLEVAFLGGSDGIDVLSQCMRSSHEDISRLTSSLFSHSFRDQRVRTVVQYTEISGSMTAG